MDFSLKFILKILILETLSTQNYNDEDYFFWLILNMSNLIIKIYFVKILSFINASFENTLYCLIGLHMMDYPWSWFEL